MLKNAYEGLNARKWIWRIKCSFRSVFIRRVFLPNVSDLRVFQALWVYFYFFDLTSNFPSFPRIFWVLCRASSFIVFQDFPTWGQDLFLGFTNIFYRFSKYFFCIFQKNLTFEVFFRVLYKKKIGFLGSRFFPTMLLIKVILW